MALSEDDQRRFDEIERALIEQDPVFSRTMTINYLRRHRVARTVWFSVGVLLLVSGLMWTQASLPWGVFFSVAGFMVMVGAAADQMGHLYRRR